jgi:TRAP-type C4-dicarboxylate transport system permease small subunit
MKIIKMIDDNFEELLLMLLLAVMAMVMGVQVVARYVFNYSLTWSEELTRYMFIWSSFLSISYCTKEQISIKIEQIVAVLPTKVHAIFKIIEKLVMLVFFVYMIKYAYNFVQASVLSGQISPACRIPMYFIQVAPLVGFILTIIRLLQSLVFEFRSLIKTN